MKRLVAVLGIVVVSCASAFAQDLPNATFGKLSGNEIQATKVAVPASGLTIAGTAVSATAAQLNAIGNKGTTGVTNVTAQTASVAGTVTLTMATNTTYYLDASTNLATNVVIYVSGVSVTTAGVTTNVAVSR